MLNNLSENSSSHRISESSPISHRIFTRQHASHLLAARGVVWVQDRLRSALALPTEINHPPAGHSDTSKDTPCTSSSRLVWWALELHSNQIWWIMVDLSSQLHHFSLFELSPFIYVIPSVLGFLLTPWVVKAPISFLFTKIAAKQVHRKRIRN